MLKNLQGAVYIRRQGNMPSSLNPALTSGAKGEDALQGIKLLLRLSEAFGCNLALLPLLRKETFKLRELLANVCCLGLRTTAYTDL